MISYIDWVTGHSLFRDTAIPSIMLYYINSVPMSSTHYSMQLSIRNESTRINWYTVLVLISCVAVSETISGEKKLHCSICSIQRCPRNNPAAWTSSMKENMVSKHMKTNNQTKYCSLITFRHLTGKYNLWRSTNVLANKRFILF